MYKDLIAKIIIYRNKISTGDDYAYDSISQTYIMALNNVIEIIKQAEPPITDKPVEEGWHWYFENDTKIIYELSEINDKICFWDFEAYDRYGHGEMAWIPVMRLQGKWQKIPEPKG